MPRGATGGDDDSLGILKLIHVLSQTSKHQSTRLGIQSSSQTIGNGLRLLKDFLEHKMLVASLFNCLQLHLQLVDVGVGLDVFNGFDLKLPIAYHGDFVIVQVHHLIGVLNDRCSIGGKEIFLFPHTNHQWRSFSSRNQRIGFL